ncbi:LysR family transcriptional regulator [Microbacterium sp. 1.5R]|uniref:LysR family transcriptional regulator n=1 Tax=Microbacterium sp. 1.5R TaxID=1916917 RepID=UPI00090BEF81|nr:LysR family transcriptional regulator [Microbacterium sp. 1.5R]APH46021.1 LysR family transcriptional regulator [Microbacterium sp. 1.5R]
MDARQLGYFLAIVDHGGFGKAAEHVHVAQPSLSQSIAALERELGVTLFHRSGRRTRLSPAGEKLVGPARRVIRELDSAGAAMSAVRGLRSGHVDISSMPSPGIEPLTSMVAAFCSRYPELTVHVDGAFAAEEVIDAVRSGTAEIGLVGTSTPTLTPGLISIPLEQQPLILIVNPADDHFSEGQTVDASELDGSRLIASPRGSLMRSMVDDTLAMGVDVAVVVEVAHRTSILPLVLSGVGHAVMPSSWASSAALSGLRTLTIEPVSMLHVAAVARSEPPTPAAAAFLEIAQEYVAARDS